MYRTAVNEVTEPELCFHWSFILKTWTNTSLATCGLYISSLCNNISVRSLFDHIQLATHLTKNWLSSKMDSMQYWC